MFYISFLSVFHSFIDGFGGEFHFLIKLLQNASFRRIIPNKKYSGDL